MPVSVGVVGTGDIAPRYLKALMACHGVDLIGVAGRSECRAQAAASLVGTAALSIDDMLVDPRVAIIVNLSAPRHHAAVTRAAIAAGKHVYSEKPLALSITEAEGLVRAAEACGVTLACAPATTLGPAQQTARRLLDSGVIGDVVGASATMIYPGPDLFHSHPQGLFANGAGPLHDMAVYDIAALHQLLGPIAQVLADARRMKTSRSVKVGPDAGAMFPVEVPTHVAAVLRFAAGPIATLTSSFAAFGARAPEVTIYGTGGALRLPGASQFDGSVMLSTRIAKWEEVASTPSGWDDDLWLVGILDMIDAIGTGESPRCCGALALHIAGTLSAIDQAIETQAAVDVAYQCPPSPMLPVDAYSDFRSRYFEGEKVA